jgi:hypothetical protein
MLLQEGLKLVVEAVLVQDRECPEGRSVHHVDNYSVVLEKCTRKSDGDYERAEYKVLRIDLQDPV